MNQRLVNVPLYHRVTRRERMYLIKAGIVNRRFVDTFGRFREKYWQYLSPRRLSLRGRGLNLTPLAIHWIAIRHGPTLAFVDSWGEGFIQMGSGSVRSVESERVVPNRIVRVLGD